MNREFTIDINGIQTMIYMQIGFVDHGDLSFPPHKHPASEMHILICGEAVLKCGAGETVLRAGDVLCLPAETVHAYGAAGKSAKRITFFVDRDVRGSCLRKISLPEEAVRLLCREIETYVLTGRDGKLRAMLSYICADFFAEEPRKPVSPLSSRELIVDDFFSQRYSESVTLNALAEALMLSPKQTEREVKRITGHTFGQELSRRRTEAAMTLLQTTDLPLSEIGERVGYTSYSGFYKALKRKGSR